MGLFDSLTGSSGLFGLGGTQGMMNPAVSLLGSNVDQAAMRNYTLKNMLLGAGIGLLNQGPSSTPINFGTTLGQGLASGLTQGQAAQKDYLQQVMQANQMKMQNQQMQLAQNADSRAAALAPGQVQGQNYQLEQAKRDAANKAAFDQFTTTLPPEQQALARNDPQGFAQMYMASKYPGRPSWGQIGSDMYGRPQYGYPPAYDPSQADHAQTAQPPAGQPTAGPDVTGLTGLDYIKNIADTKGQGYANQVQAIIEGRAPYPTGMLIKTPYGQQLATDVTQADPTFETGNAQARNKLRTDATSGTLGKSANAINTALVHLNQVTDDALKLPNGNYPVINSGKAWLTGNTGGDVYSNFNTSMGKVASELTSAYRGGGGNEADIQRELSNISPTSSPSQILGSLLNTAKLLKGKIDANQEQVDKGMGPLGGKIQLSSPEVDNIINRLETLHAKAVAGQPLTEDAPSQKSSGSLTGKTSTGVGWSFQ